MLKSPRFTPRGIMVYMCRFLVDNSTLYNDHWKNIVGSVDTTLILSILRIIPFLNLRSATRLFFLSFFFISSYLSLNQSYSLLSVSLFPVISLRCLWNLYFLLPSFQLCLYVLVFSASTTAVKANDCLTVLISTVTLTFPSLEQRIQ